MFGLYVCVYRAANFDNLNPTRLMESSNSLEDRFPFIFFFFSMEFGDGEDLFFPCSSK